LGLDPQVQAGVGGFLGSVVEADSTVGHAAAMVGQGKVLASPLGMATVVASVVAGQTVTPWIVAGDADEAAASTPGAVPLTDDEVEALRSLMAQTVVDGSATEVLGASSGVIAATGAAGFVTGAGEPATHAWIVGAKGDLAVAVFVELGDPGATVVGPVLASFLASHG
jgi:cell division protein FtsI/penicillin-binding protein 2